MNKRTVRVGLVVGMLAGLAVGGLVVSGNATASTVSGAGPAHVNLPLHSHAASLGTAVTVGSTWTWYDMEYAAKDACVVVSFGGSKIFTDDKGGAGKWKSSTKSTSFSWTAGSFAGASNKLSWASGDGYWVGTATNGGYVYGPVILASGTDPYGWGSC